MGDTLEADRFLLESKKDLTCDSESPLPPTGGVEAFLHAHPGPGEPAQAGELHPGQLHVSPRPETGKEKLEKCIKHHKMKF